MESKVDHTSARKFSRQSCKNQNTMRPLHVLLCDAKYYLAPVTRLQHAIMHSHLLWQSARMRKYERQQSQMQSPSPSPVPSLSLSMAMVMELANGRPSMSLWPCSNVRYACVVCVCNIFSRIPGFTRRGWVMSLACLGTERVQPWLLSYEKQNSSSNKTQRHNNFPLSLSVLLL